MAVLNATPQEFSLQGFPAETKSIDLFFNENRFWSLDARFQQGNIAQKWPASLKPYLKGKATLTVRDSATFEELASQEVVFTDDDVKTFVGDDNGVPLSINKWGRLGRALDAIGSDIQEAVLDRTEEIIIILRKLEKEPFIVGGTLLGAVRDGMLLPHDDDADIAYLSYYDQPADIALEGYRVGNALEDMGYVLTRHSATHMELHFEHEKTGTPYSIDVFGAFFTSDGYINQPFHVRDKMFPDQLLPFSSVEISGRQFPAPADAEYWLTINYDSDWRTPIPGFTLNTPESTDRRFLNWFGSFNNFRHYWNDLYDKFPHGKPEWQAGADWIKSVAAGLTSPHLLELGCGSDPLSFDLPIAKDLVIATDYASLPLNLAAQKAGPGKRTAHVNLLRLNTINVPERLGLDYAFDAVANHVLDQVPPQAREGAFRIFYMALLSGGSAAATFFTKPDPDVHVDEPAMWHISAADVAAEAKKFKMGVVFEEVKTSDPYTKSRAPYAAIFSLEKEILNLPKEDRKITLKRRLADFLDKFSPTKAQREVRALKEQVIELQDEIDEFRALSSRIAQLTDILEQRVERKDD